MIIPAERRAELAALFPVGGHLSVTDPWPISGVIMEHSEHGLRLLNSNGDQGFLSWFGLNASRIVRVPEPGPEAT